VAPDAVENSAPAPGLEICVFNASGFGALPDFRASGKVGLTAIMVAPQASQLVAPVFNFLPQFVQNVMDVVLWFCAGDPFVSSAHMILSLRPAALIPVIELCKGSRSLNQNRLDANQNRRRAVAFRAPDAVFRQSNFPKPPLVDMIRFHYPSFHSQIIRGASIDEDSCLVATR
jgi:hypothetical protein